MVLAALPDKKVSLIKFNMTGKVVWEKDIGVSGGNITEITELNNGNIVFGVSAAYSWNEKSLGQGYVFCYSKTGEQIWKYSYEDNIEGRIKYIFQDKAGNLLCSGNVNNGNSNYYTTDVVITKLSINGEFITEAFFGGKENELLEGSAYSESTGLIISGRTYSDDGELTDSEKDSPVDCIASINESLSLNWVYNPEKTLNYQLDKLQVEEGLIAIPGINVPQTQEEVKSGYETAYYHLILNNKGKIAHEIKIDNIASLSEVTACLTRGQNPVYVHKFIEGSKIIIKNLKGRTIFELISEVTGPERVIPTGDGGFIVIYRYPLRSLPQPLHVSSIWYDTATTLVCYNKSGQLMWQKTYDDYQNNTINDYLYVAY